MGITVEARYKGRHLILDQSLSLPEGQRVRVTIEPIDEVTVGQRIVDQWREAGVIGVWKARGKTLSSAQWARRLRKRVSQRTQ
ncbi:MAG: antitoxin family protein [Fimbriimonadales bacterium]